MGHMVWWVAAVFGVYVTLELLLGRFWPRKNASVRENWLDVFAASQAWFLVGPLAVYLTAGLERWLLPDYADRWIGAPLWLQLPAFLVFEDMVQYWYHRAMHRYAWLWPFHKFHHSPPFMGIRIIWRNSFFYDLFMPNLYLASVLVYLGFGGVYLWYYVFKLLVTMGSHSELRWDAWLYRHKALAPLAWVIERTFSTPATHFAHHARLDDPAGNPHGNFGNLLFLWDVIFGSAKITRRYPENYGLTEEPGREPDPWYVYIFYPLARPRR